MTTTRGLSLAEYAPKLAKEFHPTKNGALEAGTISRSSKDKIWWLGACGHEWDMPVVKRTQAKSQGCPFCSSRRVLEGFNDLATTHPHIAEDWDYDLNDFSPTEVVKSTARRAWFKCRNHEHSYFMTISARTHPNEHGCNVCSGHVILPGFNDLRTLFPKVAKEMDRADNGEMDSTKVGAGVRTRVNFMCDHGHVWDASICNRTSTKVQSGCPFCCNQKVLAGYNDLLSLHPEIAKRFDEKKNRISPDSIISTSNRKYWFNCDNGHSSEVVLSTVVRLGVGCSYCVNRKAWAGENDLETMFPEIAAEFDITKNKGVLPSEVPFGSHSRYWFSCKNGHSWITAVTNRTNRGDGCAECAGYQSSAVENKFSEILNERSAIEVTPKVNKNRIPVPWGKHKTMTVDILGKVNGLEHPVVFEYDGAYWHRDKFDKDLEKTKLLLAAGYIVVRIRERNLEYLDLTDEHLFQINTVKQNIERYNDVADEIEKWLLGLIVGTEQA